MTENSTRTLREPFGKFEQGEPLIICRNDRNETLTESARRLQIKGYYCGYNTMIAGRRFGRVYFDIHDQNMSQQEFANFWRWVMEVVATSLPPKGAEFIFV